CPFSHLDTRECLTSKISAKSFCVILFSFLYFFISSPRFSIFFFIGDFTSLDKASSTDQPFFNLAPILSGLILYISPHSTKVKDSPLYVMILLFLLFLCCSFIVIHLQLLGS